MGEQQEKVRDKQSDFPLKEPCQHTQCLNQKRQRQSIFTENYSQVYDDGSTEPFLFDAKISSLGAFQSAISTMLEDEGYLLDFKSVFTTVQKEQGEGGLLE